MNNKETILLKYALPLAVSNSNRGRPKIDFADSSKKTKRRRVAEVAKYDESAAAVLRSSDFQSNSLFSEANTDEILSLLMETNLTKHQYFANSYIYKF